MTLTETHSRLHAAHLDRISRMRANPVPDAGIDLRPLRHRPHAVVTLPTPRAAKAAATMGQARPVAVVAVIARQLPPPAEGDDAPRHLRIIHIQSATADYFNMPLAKITGHCRVAHIVLARHIAIYLSTTLTRWSIAGIGRQMGRDHSTVFAALKKMKRLAGSPAIIDAIKSVKEILRDRGFELEDADENLG